MNPKAEMSGRIAETLTLIEQDLLAQDKPLSFLGLFLREDSPNLWDAVVSAPWIEQDKRAAVAYLAERLNHHLDADEIVAISRIATVNPDDPRMKAYVAEFFPATSRDEIATATAREFFDMEMARAILFRTPGQLHPPGTIRGRQA